MALDSSLAATVIEIAHGLDPRNLCRSASFSFGMHLLRGPRGASEIRQDGRVGSPPELLHSHRAKPRPILEPRRFVACGSSIGGDDGVQALFGASQLATHWCVVHRDAHKQSHLGPISTYQTLSEHAPIHSHWRPPLGPMSDPPPHFQYEGTHADLKSPHICEMPGTPGRCISKYMETAPAQRVAVSLFPC